MEASREAPMVMAPGPSVLHVPAIVRMLVAFAGYVFLLVMAALPLTQTLVPLKAALLGFLLLTAVLLALGRLRLKIHKEVIGWTIFVAIVGLGFGLEGIIYDTTGPLPELRVLVLWPILYTVLLSLLTEPSILFWAHKVLVLATAMGSAIVLLQPLSRLGFVPGAAFFTSELFGKTRAHSLMSLPFLVPFVLTAAIVWRPRQLVSRLFLFATVALGVAATLIGGRRALQLVIGLTPLLLVAFMMLARPQQSVIRKSAVVKLIAILAILAVASGVVLSASVHFDWSKVTAHLISGFQFGVGASYSEAARRDQFQALMSGWLEHPLLGNGLGAYAKQCIRDQDMPWAYELSYVALLFKTGILGCICYAGAAAWIYVRALRVMRNSRVYGTLMLCDIIALTTYLIANATNPYLARFDGIWELFVPVAVLNAAMLTRVQRRNSPPTDAIDLDSVRITPPMAGSSVPRNVQ